MTIAPIIKEPISYSAFTLDTVRKRFDIHVVLQKFITDFTPVTPSDTLKDNLTWASVIFLISEKARSEFIVAPILLEIVRLLGNSVSVLSGARLDVAPEEGLQGVCDFIISKSPPVPIVQAPLIIIVEAKKSDIEEGLGQCAAEMVGAQRFNELEGKYGQVVYGCVTTGETWQFLKLADKLLMIDPEKVNVEHVDRILGILVKMATL